MAILSSKKDKNEINADAIRLDIYRIIGEGYKAMRDGKACSMEDVQQKLEKRRMERG